MDEMEKRLTACFSAVLPDLAPEEISQASSSSVEGWDSVATVSLLAVIEEEFGISIDDENPARFNSFESLLSYLREAGN
jgi:acyl carrier protein